MEKNYKQKENLLKIFIFFIGIGLAISGICGFYILMQTNGAGPADSWFISGQVLVGFACLIGLSIAKNLNINPLK